MTRSLRPFLILKTHDERAFLLYCKSGEGGFSYSEAEAEITLEMNDEGEEEQEDQEDEMASPPKATARMKASDREMYHAFNRLFLYLTWATEDSCPQVNTELYRQFSVDSLDQPNNGPGIPEKIR